MNRQQTERMARRLDALEQRRPEMLPVVRRVVVTPGEHGPRLTGQVLECSPGGSWVQVQAPDPEFAEDNWDNRP